MVAAVREMGAAEVATPYSQHPRPYSPHPRTTTSQKRALCVPGAPTERDLHDLQHLNIRFQHHRLARRADA